MDLSMLLAASSFNQADWISLFATMWESLPLPIKTICFVFCLLLAGIHFLSKDLCNVLQQIRESVDGKKSAHPSRKHKTRQPVYRTSAGLPASKRRL